MVDGLATPEPVKQKRKSNKVAAAIVKPQQLPPQPQPQMISVSPTASSAVDIITSEESDFLNLLMQDISSSNETKTTTVLMEEKSYDLTVCPFHKCKLTVFESQNGDEFIKCQVEQCCLFSSMERFQDYMKTVNEKLHPSYFKIGELVCKCERPVTLRVSQSEKNPNRPLFGCREKEKEDQCGFFQWGNIPLLKKNKNVQKKNPLKHGPCWNIFIRLFFNYNMWQCVCPFLVLLFCYFTPRHDGTTINNNHVYH